MANEVTKELKLEIAHVLFIDIIDYSKLLMDDQRSSFDKLNAVVRNSEQFQSAERAGSLLKIPTGDGMALVFRNSAEEPVRCALEIARALKAQSDLSLRMGIHSGPVSGVVDVNERANVAGAGINMAQRVMDCGDAGHILLSKHVAEDLEQYARWKPLLHELGECEVKHGVRVGVVNLYAEEFGNPKSPQKFAAQRKQRARARLIAAGIGLAALAAIAAAFFFVSKRSTSPVLDKSIAVLPFENLSRDPDNAFFAEGVQDEILTNLAKIADLKVISRTSVMPYKTGLARNLREIGKQLGVAHVLEGSVQRAANRVRVNAQLIDARNDAHLWAEIYDRDLADVFAIQSEIAKTIADQLRVRLSAQEKTAVEKKPTADLEAYDLFLRARTLYLDSTDQSHVKEKLPESIRLLNAVVTRDPKFVAAWSLLSTVYGTSYYFGLDHTAECLEKAKSAAQTALTLDRDSGEAHLAKALYLYHGFLDFNHAREELALARRTLPNDAQVPFFTGVFDYRQGDWKSATSNIERAVELDPRNLLYVQQMALCYQPQRRYADELRMWQRALSIVPNDGPSRVAIAVVAANERADMKPYQETIDALLKENPDKNRELDDPFCALRERSAGAAARVLRNYSTEGIPYYGVNYPHTYWEAVVARWQGDAAKAREKFAATRSELEKVLRQQPDFPAALSLVGLIDAGLGRKEDAIREGEHACQLLPMSKDAVDGVACAANLAEIYAWCGDKDRAIEQLKLVESVPNDVHYGELKLHPRWDPLRGDPRFEQIVASQGPREIAPR